MPAVFRFPEKRVETTQGPNDTQGFSSFLMMTNGYLQNRFLKIFCIFACGFILYSFVLAAPFKTLDDRASISQNQYVSSLKYIPQIFRSSFFGGDFYYRPLVSLTYALERHLFGLNYFFFNLGNILLHLMTALIVFCLITTLFKDEALGFWAGFLFAIHPIQSEAVANIPGRSILLCGFFELSALLLFCLFSQKQKRRYLFFSLGAFVLALLSKESSATLPITIFMYTLLFNRDAKRPLLKSAKAALPFFLIFLGYLLLRCSLKISSMSFVLNAKDYFCGIFTFFQGFLTYLRMIIFPVNLYSDRITPVIYDFFSPAALLTIAGIGLCAASFVYFYKRLKPEVLFLIFFVIIRFLPLSQLIPIRSQASYICVPDHFLYVPSVGLLTLLVLLFRLGTKKAVEQRTFGRAFLNTLVAGWIGFLCLTTIEQNIYATNEIAMYSRSVRFVPRHVRMNIALGLSYVLEKDFKDAEKYFRQALADEPSNIRARLSLGTALLDQGLYWEGLAEYERISTPGNFKQLLDENKNLAFRILIGKYQAMLQTDSLNAKVYYSLGVVYAKKEEFTIAIDYFQKALSLDPRLENARANLCNCYKALGQNETAGQCFSLMGEQK